MSSSLAIATKLEPGPGEADAGLAFADENNVEDMYLTFGVGGEVYGVGIVHVTEIVGMQRVMPVPDVPDYIKGVINLRGKVIAVMDVRARFGMAVEPYTERTVIIVLEVNRAPTGLVVDDVRDVLEIPPARIDPSPNFGAAREGRSLIRGLGKAQDQLAVIVDVYRLVEAEPPQTQASEPTRQ